MANETIYGCVDWATGKVEFTQDACTYVNGCIHWTGEHAGQVAVIIDTLLCDDTYYACIDWATGKFQVVIPDDCCVAISGRDCACFDPDTTPSIVKVVFSGISPCPGPAQQPPNGTWFLIDISDATHPCYWKYLDANWNIYVWLRRNIGGAVFRTELIALDRAGRFYFLNYEDECTSNHVHTNSYIEGECGMLSREAFGGIGTVSGFPS